MPHRRAANAQRAVPSWQSARADTRLLDQVGGKKAFIASNDVHGIELPSGEILAAKTALIHARAVANRPARIPCLSPSIRKEISSFDDEIYDGFDHAMSGRCRARSFCPLGLCPG